MFKVMICCLISVFIIDLLSYITRLFFKRLYCVTSCLLSKPFVKGFLNIVSVVQDIDAFSAEVYG